MWHLSSSQIVSVSGGAKVVRFFVREKALITKFGFKKKQTERDRDALFLTESV